MQNWVVEMIERSLVQSRERADKAEQERDAALATIAALTGKIERIRATAEEDRKGRCPCKMSLGTPMFLECLMHLTIRKALIAAFASVSCGCSDKSSDYKCSVDSWHDVARGASFIALKDKNNQLKQMTPERFELIWNAQVAWREATAGPGSQPKTFWWDPTEFETAEDAIIEWHKGQK